MRRGIQIISGFWGFKANIRAAREFLAALVALAVAGFAVGCPIAAPERGQIIAEGQVT